MNGCAHPFFRIVISACCLLSSAAHAAPVLITETEPNDTQATANPLGTADGATGSIGRVGDLDYYSFVVSNPATFATEITSDVALQFTLYAPDSSVYARTNGGVTTFDYGALQSVGTYRLLVNAAGNNAAIPEYAFAFAQAPTAAVPEPASLALLAIGAACLRKRRIRRQPA